MAGVATWAVVVLPALVGWLAAPESRLGWFSAVSMSSALWFLGHGQSIDGPSIVVSFTPLLLLLVFVYVAERFARRLVARQRLAVGPAAYSRVVQRAIVPGFLVGYLAVSAVAALFTLGGPVGPGASGIVGALGVPLLALGVVLLRPDDDDAPAFVRSWFRRGPTWLPATWRIGWRGAGLLGLLGLGVALARVAMSFDAVTRVQADYGVNVAGAVVLGIAQVLLLGNAATWGLAFLAGPGFQLAMGATISPAAAHPGLMPLVPVLAALPNDADFPPSLYAVVLVPVAAGLAIGRWVDADLEFFGNVPARLAATTTAATLSVAVVVVLTAVGTGALGVERLSAVGPPTGSFAVALLIEVVAGALLWVGYRLLLERRTQQHERAEADRSDHADHANHADHADSSGQVDQDHRAPALDAADGRDVTVPRPPSASGVSSD